MENNTPKYASWVPTAGGYVADGKVVSTSPQYDEQGKFRVDVDRSLFAQPQTQTQTTQVAAQPTSGITTANATGSGTDANATATGIGSLGSLSENTGRSTTGVLDTQASKSPLVQEPITSDLQQAWKDYDYMVATNNIQGQINALTKISRITGQDYSAQINSLAEARTNKINSANEEFTQRYNQAIAGGDIEGANQILAEQQKWLESVNAPQELPTLEGQYQQEQQGLQIAYEKKYLDGIDQITEAIVQLTGNILNFQYNPYTDTALQIAQGYAVNRVKETMNSTGMYFSSMTTSAITKAVAELVPVYEKMAKDEMRQNLSMLQSTANYLMNLEQAQFNMWKSQIELQFEANNDRRKEVAAAWDRVNNIGYVDNQASAILGVAAGTLSPNAREHLQSLQEEIAKENRNLIQNMVLADYKNELEIDRMNEQAKLDVWKYNQQQATAYRYNSQLKKEQFGYDLALANAKNSGTKSTGIKKDVSAPLSNAGVSDDVVTKFENLLNGDYTTAEKQQFFKDNKLEATGTSNVAQLGNYIAEKNNDPLMSAYGNQLERQAADYANTLMLSTYVDNEVIPKIESALFNKLGSDYEKTKTALDEALDIANEEAAMLAGTGYEGASAEIAKIYNTIVEKIENTKDFDYSEGNLLDNYTKLKEQAENDILKSIKNNSAFGEDADAIAETVAVYLATIKKEGEDVYRDDFRTNSIRALGNVAGKAINTTADLLGKTAGTATDTTINTVSSVTNPPLYIGKNIYDAIKSKK